MTGGRRERLVSEALGGADFTWQAHPGGSANRAAVLKGTGRCYFLKWNDLGIPDQFRVEADGLRRMSAVAGGPVIPAPVAYGDGADGFLLMELLRTGERENDFDEHLGRGLAAMHRHTADRYGFGWDGTCGGTPQRNGWMDEWPAFYRERRLMPQLELAERNGIGVSGLGVLRRLADRLTGLLAQGDASLLHGDLWTGNVFSSQRGPALVDPAPYYGHREAELGMMVMFGGFSPRVFAAYDEAWPLVAGWRERLPLYTLYHVLNHFNLFGGAYGADAVDIARRYAG